MGFLTGMILGGLLDGAVGDDAIGDGMILGGIIGAVLGSSESDEEKKRKLKNVYLSGEITISEWEEARKKLPY